MIINFSDINFPLILVNEKNNNYLHQIYSNNKIKYSLNIKNLYNCLKNGNTIKNKDNIVKLLRLYKNNIYDNVSTNIKNINSIVDIKTRNELTYYDNDIIKLNNNLYFNFKNSRFYLQKPNQELLILNTAHIITNNQFIQNNIIKILNKNIRIKKYSIKNDKNLKFKYYQEMGIFHKYQLIINTNLVFINKFLINKWENFKKISTVKQLKKIKIRDLFNIDTLIITYECIKNILSNKLFLSNESKIDKSIEICHKKDILNDSCYYLFTIYWNNIIFEDINEIKNKNIIKFLSKLNCKKKYLFSNTINKKIMEKSYYIGTGYDQINYNLYKKYIDTHIYSFKNKNNKNININYNKINNSFNNIFYCFLNEYYGENIYDENLQKLYSLININNSEIIINNIIDKKELINFYNKKNINCSHLSNDNLKCSVCYNNHSVNNYCHLHCGHYFCISCFPNILHFNNYKCPLCRNKFNYQEYFLINNQFELNFNKINKCFDIINKKKKYVIISKWSYIINIYLKYFKKKNINCKIINKSNNIIQKFNDNKINICFIPMDYLNYNYSLKCDNFILLDPFCIDKKDILINNLKNKSTYESININVLYTDKTIEEKYVSIIRDLI